MKMPYPTEEDKEKLYKYLPSVKTNLISDLKAEGWNEKWIRHLIWRLRRSGDIYMFQGIAKKTERDEKVIE